MLNPISLLIVILFFFSSTTIAQQVITEQQKNDLVFLREEEKLARDVYLFSFNKYGTTVFNTIAQSEQRHMDAILAILETYDVRDPVGNNEKGVFENKTLQYLYDSLTATSSTSLILALKVGATIEDLDIKDIEGFKKNTKQQDILKVYERLVCGSKNHIRSFSHFVQQEGGTYKNQFISNEDFTTILNGVNGPCGSKGGHGMPARGNAKSRGKENE